MEFLDMSDKEAPALFCYYCKKNIPVLGAFKVNRTEDCPYCTRALHCCKMCKFYDSRIYNECKESMADRVIDKEKANFCDYFNLSDGKHDESSAEKLKSAADSLFKN
jgi:hypothetical protein